MNKYTALIAALILSACGTSSSPSAGGLFGTAGGTASGVGAGLVQMYVQNQCVTELQSRNEWRMAALAMSQAQQAAWEQKICGCVSEEAPNQLSAAELLQLGSESGRAQVLTNVTARTVNACYRRLFTGNS